MLIKGKRRGLSAEQKAELWNRWKAGQSLNEIGRALGKDHVVVHFVLARHGGIAPPARRRSRRVLTLDRLLRLIVTYGFAAGGFGIRKVHEKPNAKVRPSGRASARYSS
jgi:hypothetical protein